MEFRPMPTRYSRSTSSIRTVIPQSKHSIAFLLSSASVLPTSEGARLGVGRSRPATTMALVPVLSSSFAIPPTETE